MGTEILRLPAMPRSLASSLKTCNKTTIKRGKIGKGGNTALFHLGCLCFSRNARVAALTGLTVSVFEDQKGSIFFNQEVFPRGNWGTAGSAPHFLTSHTCESAFWTGLPRFLQVFLFTIYLILTEGPKR